MANTQKNKYRGKVKLAFKSGNTIIKKVTHNTGLSDMALLFAQAIAAELNQATDVPRVIDIGYIPKLQDGTGVWTSLLNKPVMIGGRQFSFDSALDNWVATLIATIYYSDLNGGILDAALANSELDDGDDNKIDLKLRLCSYESKNRKYFAEVDITADEIRAIKETTAAIITWYTELLYDYDSNLETGNI